MSLNCWEILGIEPTDDKNAIRDAYRKKLPQHHPEKDPDGFKNLRLAYEEANKSAQAAFKPVSALVDAPLSLKDLPANEDEGETREEVQGDALPSDVTEVLNALRQLLDTPEKRYEPLAWHEFIQRLDMHSISTVNQLCWPLLDVLEDANNLSKNCARLLSERLRWKQRLSELSGERFQFVERFLHFLEKDDFFDMTQLSALPLPAQNAIVDHIETIHYLFWERPTWMLSAYLEQHHVTYWPDSPELMALRCRWYAHAGIGDEGLLAYCLEQMTDNPDDVDWLWLYASHCSLCGHNERALPFWIRLHDRELHAGAEAWLLSWCQEFSPQKLPLLIQALDRPQYPDAEGIAPDAPTQSYLTRTQTSKTLLRWSESSLLDLPPLAADYAAWRATKGPQTSVLRHLIAENGYDPLLRLYRHAAMLHLGDETLLQQIIDEPLPDSALDAFILRGLQRQAQENLRWLQTSSVIKAFVEWLTPETSAPLPDAFANKDSDASQQAMNWIRRSRWLETHQLQKLVDSEQFGGSLDIVTDWISFITLNNSMPLPAPKQDEDYWDWCRKRYALALLLETPAEALPMLHQVRGLTVEADHPLYTLWERVQGLQGDGDLVAQYRDSLTLSYILQYHSWTRLPITPEQYLENNQTTTSYSADHFYLSSQTWRERIWRSNNYHQLVFYAACAYCGHNSPVERFTKIMEDMTLDKEQETAMRKALIELKPYAFAQNVRHPRLLMLINEITALRKSERYVTPQPRQKALSECMSDEKEDISLRLAAKLLLQEARQREKRQGSDKKPSRFWQFWRFNTRLNRSGYLAQVLVGTIAAYFVSRFAISLSSDVNGPMLFGFLMLLNGASAVVRRINDIGLGLLATVCVIILIFVVTPAALILLLIPGTQSSTNAGPPPERWFNL
ncbi:hypothetical protein SOASR030_32590 [Leminorella grimontii]|uniref:J domain-containing protein n=1 Tax=Leminorella grimontii TaxID=82981 RepID=A0AAV5N8S6_9GAMM|nr:DUF805 domain-containing protein [Leminorella grimontii]KFC92653.1 hypothetical protein GLGR_3762 [Leminorella grimontii ATCC 33999 = DSM 5078]GKX57147.1 hypothetical protein SOASR030_32590 [Leminorella grimontii]VFS62656.1 Predicted membrane protein [Leminorella grimontii]